MDKNIIPKPIISTFLYLAQSLKIDILLIKWPFLDNSSLDCPSFLDLYFHLQFFQCHEGVFEEEWLQQPLSMLYNVL